jgi:hypothetical protein
VVKVQLVLGSRPPAAFLMALASVTAYLVRGASLVRGSSVATCVAAL